MAHARKPKADKKRSRPSSSGSAARTPSTPNSTSSRQGVQKLKRVKLDDGTLTKEDVTVPHNDLHVQQSHEAPKAIVNIQGERVHVQTRLDKYAKTMNRPSVFFKLGTEDFLDKFAACWKEHIEGFVGLRGSKRERTEKEKSMEWRQRVKDLKKVKKNLEVKKSGQTVSDRERMMVVQKYREMMAAKKKPSAALAE